MCLLFDDTLIFVAYFIITLKNLIGHVALKFLVVI